MSSFKKLIDSAKNQPAQEEAPVDLTPESSTKELELNSTNGHVEAPVASEKVSPKKKKKAGKSQNSDYRQTTIYVRKDLHRMVTRLLEDQGYNGDFSDWVEKCMISTIKKQKL